jgi:hypothetical protein
MRRTDLGELCEDFGLKVRDFLVLLGWLHAGRVERRTGTASMTKSTSDRSSSLVLEVNRSLVALASSLDILPLPMSFSRSLSANLRPLSIEVCELSMICTGTEALCAATRAIPSPYHDQS